MSLWWYFKCLITLLFRQHIKIWFLVHSLNRFGQPSMHLQGSTLMKPWPNYIWAYVLDICLLVYNPKACLNSFRVCNSITWSFWRNLIIWISFLFVTLLPCSHIKFYSTAIWKQHPTETTSINSLLDLWLFFSYL